MLGGMYEKGEGVPQDYVQAHKWYNLAASYGELIAIKGRDDVADASGLAPVGTLRHQRRQMLAG